MCAKCGGPTETATNGYCRACKREYDKANRHRRTKHRDLSDENRKKANARSYLNVYLRRGKIDKKPCEHEGCGEINVMAFHADYDKPLEVTWYCKTHHAEENKKRQLLSGRQVERICVQHPGECEPRTEDQAQCP